jgi:hypothetical protein
VIKGEERPQLRCEVLENESCKVNKLIWHVKIKLGFLADRSVEFLNRKVETRTRLDICGCYQLKKKKYSATVEASNSVAQRTMIFRIIFWDVRQLFYTAVHPRRQF